MHWLIVFTLVCTFVSLLKDTAKTKTALKSATKKLSGIFQPFLLMIIIVSLILYFVPDSVIAQLLGKESGTSGIFTAAIIGSISMMPGFIVFPLCGLLREKSVPYMILSSFTTTLMMVGIITLPLEQKYLGIKTAIVRNIAGFLTALITALITGLFFGEL